MSYREVTVIEIEEVLRLVVDECHTCPAVTIGQVVGQIPQAGCLA